MPKNPLAKKIKKLESHIEKLEDQIATHEYAIDESEPILKDIEKFCEECTIRREKECAYCHLYKYYIGK